MNGFLLFVIIAVISSLVKKARETDGDNPPAAGTRRPNESRSPARPGEIVDYDERMRRIREEIRRKIEERRSAAQTGLPPSTPAPAKMTETEYQPEPLTVPEEAAPPQPALTAPERRHQAEAVEELAVQAELKQTEQTIAEARAAELSWTESTKPATGTSALRKDLRSGRDLRRAIALREVLGPPVALR